MSYILAGLVAVAIAYGVGFAFGTIAYSLSDVGMRRFNVVQMFYWGAAWPWLLGYRLVDDARRLSGRNLATAKIPETVKPYMGKARPRSGQETGLYS